VTFRSYPKEVRGLKFVMQLERLLCDLAKAALEKHKRYLGWPTIGREEREKKGFGGGFWYFVCKLKHTSNQKL